MPQLDIYIIKDLVYNILIILLIIYILNIKNTLLTINTCIRLRKYKIYLDKKYIWKIIQEISEIKNINFLKQFLIEKKKWVEKTRKFWLQIKIW